MRSRPSRRNILLGGAAGLAAAAEGIQLAQAQTRPAAPGPAAAPAAGASTGRPNIVVIWGDDVGLWNISHFNRGMMGYRTPGIDRIFQEGMSFTDYYAEQSCTAGRSAFITGQSTARTGLSKVGLPGSVAGMQPQDPTIARMMKAQGYATGQFGKNHLGDRDEHLPTMHGFDEYFGSLYHLNASEEPENEDYPRNPEFRRQFGPRGVLNTRANPDGTQTIEDTGQLTRQRMETIDEEILAKTTDFIKRQHDANRPFFVWHNSTRMHFRTHVPANLRGRSSAQTPTAIPTMTGCWTGSSCSSPHRPWRGGSTRHSVTSRHASGRIPSIWKPYCGPWKQRPLRRADSIRGLPSVACRWQAKPPAGVPHDARRPLRHARRHPCPSIAALWPASRLQG
jgi:arylsulfatase